MILIWVQAQLSKMSISSNTYITIFLIALNVVSKSSQGWYVEQNTHNSCLQLENSGCQGLRTAFSITFLSLKLALKVVTKCTDNVLSQSQYADQHTKNLCLQLQNSGCQGLRTVFSNIFLSLKLALKVVPKSTHDVFSQSQYADQNTQNSR